MKISQRILKILEQVIWPQQKFTSIVLEADCLQNIMDFAKANYPREFSAILQGEIEKNTMNIKGLIYQHFHSNRTSSLMHMNLPMISHAVGSVHSHPSSSTRPSDADLRFFAKTGVVHLIIGYPYDLENITCYDFEGNIRGFQTS